MKKELFRSLLLIKIFTILVFAHFSANASSLVVPRELSYESYRLEEVRSEKSELKHVRDKEYLNTALQITNTSSVVGVGKNRDEINLNSQIEIYDNYIEFSREMKLPNGKELILNRQFYRYNSSRGFSLHRREFESFSVEMMRQLIKNEYPDHAKEILRVTNIVPLNTTDYICEPDFTTGFNCYYKFDVEAYLLNRSELGDLAQELPDRIRLSFEASDYFTQDHHILTGQKTTVYKFEFGKVFESTIGEQLSHLYLFDFEFESVEVINDGELSKEYNLNNGEFLDCNHQGLILERFEMASLNHATQLRRSLANRLRSSGLSVFESVRENYTNEDKKCELNKTEKRYDCSAEDRLELRITIPIPSM